MQLLGCAEVDEARPDLALFFGLEALALTLGLGLGLGLLAVPASSGGCVTSQSSARSASLL